MSSPLKEMELPSSLTDVEWEKIQKAIPERDESLLDHFLTTRDKIIDSEKGLRSDVNFRRTCSSVAQECCSIVSRIRNEEQRFFWNSEAAKALGQKPGIEYHPGMIFSKAKKLMEMTKLWKIVKRMPKGAVLHAHLDAMVDMGFLFDLLLSTPGIHMFCATGITNAVELETSPIKFRFLKSSDDKALNKKFSIWSTDYIPNSPIPVTQAADTFPYGKRPVFLQWLRSRCSITAKESLNHHNGVNDIWKKFSSIFPILDSILFYEPIFRRCLRRIFSQLNADGVRWADLRLSFIFRYYREGNEEPDPNFKHLFQVFGEELDKFQASEEGKKFWGSRIIWTGIRSLETRKIIQDMKACISMKKTYPQLISGYDLVGQEDAGRTLDDLLPELFWFRQKTVEEDIEIPFFFHAGECIGDGSEADQNLFDAIFLESRRIGHGFSLYKHPILMDAVRKRKILVESCPISNEVLRLCSSINSHPLPALIANGISCSLSNDDPTILGQDTVGLTHDFWQALQGWDNLGLAGLASLAENSVRWAAFEDEDKEGWLKGIEEGSLGSGVKAIRLRQWHDEWEQFCQWVLTEFGETQTEPLLEKTSEALPGGL